MSGTLDFSLFGDELIKPSTGETIDPALALVDKVVILYFSAHWCAPCNKFTPKLHLFHQLQDDKEDYEIVFCSMDRSKEEYDKYAEQMPWWCLPYAISTLPKLAEIYHAHGIPHMVVIDRDGSVITREGVESLTRDPVGARFPWRPQPVVDILPKEYISSTSERKPMTDLDEKYLMLYFAQKECGLCQDFTPWLVKAFNILKKRRPDDFELLFVSGDMDQYAFDKHFQMMTFGAIPFEYREAKDLMEKRLDVPGYPTLLILGPINYDADGDRPIINMDVRSVIENGDYISDFPFYPKPYGDLCTTKDDINTHKCLIVFHEGGDDEEQDDVEEILKEASEELRWDDEGTKFYWAFDMDAPLSSNIREACGLGPVSEEPAMVFLDIPNDGAFYISGEDEVSVESIRRFLANKGERHQI